jgi:hypothetical protein
MFSKGQRVRVKPYERTRTIFQNAEVTPGQTTRYDGGWTAIVTNVFEGFGPDDPIFEVLKDGYHPDGQGYAEFSLEELENYV